MSRAINTTARLASKTLAGLGTFAGARLTLEHLPHGGVCPMLGPVPACIIVFLGYFLVLIAAMFLNARASKPLFFVGWASVFLLAFMGVILELTQGQTCPSGAFGIPQCFFSLAMVLICLGLFNLSRKSLSAA